MLVKPSRDRPVGRVYAEGDVSGEHHRRVRLRVVVGVGHRALGRRFLRRPLPGPGGALDELPLIVEEVVEVASGPGRGRGGPRAFQSTGDRVGTLAGAEAVFPAEALLLDGSGLRRRPDVVGGRRPVALAEGMAAGDQGHRLLVVHRHPGERFPDVLGRGQRVRLPVGTLGVDVDKAHLHGGQRVVELAVASVPLVAKPLALRAPVDVVLRFPDIRAAATKAERLETHRLKPHVAREDHQVGPGDAVAILLLDRPEQPTSLVEVGVVGPTVEGCKPLRAVARTAAAVGHAVGAGAVPGHADEERAVMAVVGRPPVLRRRHQGLQVLFHGREVELLELLCVVEGRSQRISGGRVPVEDGEVDLVGPPVAVGHPAGSSRAGGGRGVADHRADRGRFLGKARAIHQRSQADDGEGSQDHKSLLFEKAFRKRLVGRGRHRLERREPVIDRN